MMQGSPEKQTVNPQEVDKGRRQLVFGTIAGVTMLAAEGALSQVEQAHAAVKKIVDFRDRRGNINSANSTSHDPQTTTMNTTQGEPVTVQVTPTPDLQATKTTLDIEAERLAIQKQQTDNSLALLTDVVAPVGTTVAIGTLVYTILRGQNDQRAQEQQRRTDRIEDQRKRDETRFQEAVLALGKDETKLGAATTLRTFLQEEGKGYERFYKQIFDLTVGFLQNRVVDPNNPKPDTFNGAIIKLFIESFPRARKLAKEQFEKDKRMYNPVYLDASDVKLDSVDLSSFAFSGLEIDLSEAWMRNASFKDADLFRANLSKAFLLGANLSRADFTEVNLTDANLSSVNLNGTILDRTILKGAILGGTDLSGTDLSRTDLTGARLVD